MDGLPIRYRSLYETIAEILGEVGSGTFWSGMPARQDKEIAFQKSSMRIVISTSIPTSPFCDVAAMRATSDDSLCEAHRFAPAHEPSKRLPKDSRPLIHANAGDA